MDDIVGCGGGYLCHGLCGLDVPPGCRLGFYRRAVRANSEPTRLPRATSRPKRSRGVIIASSACARRSSSRLARLSTRRCQSALIGMISLGRLEIVLSIVPFHSAEDGASLPCCHFGHSRHGYCAVQHMAMDLVAASTKKARACMAVLPEPSASRPAPSSGSRSFVLTIGLDSTVVSPGAIW